MIVFYFKLKIFKNQSIKNIIYYFPIIWKDRDWDHFYIYQIIEFKLRGQAKYIGTKDRHTRAKEDARDMLICANLIAKIKDGFYDGEYMDYHESEFKFLPIEDKPGFSELKIDTISEEFDSYFKKYRLPKIFSCKRLPLFKIKSFFLNHVSLS